VFDREESHIGAGINGIHWACWRDSFDLSHNHFPAH
jgi:hypothetical protein